MEKTKKEFQNYNKLEDRKRKINQEEICVKFKTGENEKTRFIKVENK